MVCFENANGIQIVDLEESFRMRQSTVIFVLQVSRYGHYRFGKGSYYMGNLQGKAGGTRETEPGEPRGAAFWSLHIHNNSKNPSKQCLVRETFFRVIFMHILDGVVFMLDTKDSQ